MSPITASELVKKLEEFFNTLPASLPEITVSPRAPYQNPYTAEVTIHVYMDLKQEEHGKAKKQE